MLDATKEQVAAALGAVRKAASHWQKCLLVSIEGIGQYDVSAVRAARDAYEQSVANVSSILAPTVAAEGLLAAARESHMESVTFERDGREVTPR